MKCRNDVIRLGISVALAVLLAAPLLATNYVWTGSAGDSNWMTSANWVTNRVTAANGAYPGTNDVATLTNNTAAGFTVILNLNGSSIGNLGGGTVTNGLAGLILSNSLGTATLIITNGTLVTTGAGGVVFSSNSVLEIDNNGVFTNANTSTGVKIVCTNFVLKLGGGGLYSPGSCGTTALQSQLGNSILTIQSSSNGFGGAFYLNPSSAYWDPSGGVGSRSNNTIVMNCVTGYCSQHGFAPGANTAFITNDTLYVTNNAIFVAPIASTGVGFPGSSNLLYVASGCTYVAQTLYAGNIGSLAFPCVGNIAIVNGGTINCAGLSVAVGSAAAAANSNAMIVSGGNANVATNFIATGDSSVGALGANCNFLIVSNGGVAAFGGKLAIPLVTATNAYGNYALVTGPGSLLRIATHSMGSAPSNGTQNVTSNNGMTVVNGGVVTNIGNLTFQGYQTYLNIASNGAYYFPISSTFKIGCQGIGPGTNDSYCGINVSANGLLDVGIANVSVGINSNGNICNFITNSGGILQFAQTAPTIAVGSNGLTGASANGNNITITNGTLSFRNVNNASVYCNQGAYRWGSSTTSGGPITYLGTNNTFMLNGINSGCTNNSGLPANQSYTFSAGYNSTNWAGLVMVNGTASRPTMYTNGFVTIESTGWATFSNGYAVVASNVTCAGTMNIANSTVTFGSNLVLQSGFTLNVSSNSTTPTVINVVKDLDLSSASSGTINTTGLLQNNPAQVTLCTVSGSILGSPGNWTVTGPLGYKYVASASGNSLILQQVPSGLMVLIK